MCVSYTHTHAKTQAVDACGQGNQSDREVERIRGERLEEMKRVKRKGKE